MKIESDVLEGIATRCGPTSVQVGEFFMSWNSVMTLAYEGFSKTPNMTLHMDMVRLGPNHASGLTVRLAKRNEAIPAQD